MALQKCKGPGLIFRFRNVDYWNTDEPSFNHRSSMKLLKRKSCHDCVVCDKIIEDMPILFNSGKVIFSSNLEDGDACILKKSNKGRMLRFSKFKEVK